MLNVKLIKKLSTKAKRYIIKDLDKKLLFQINNIIGTK